MKMYKRWCERMMAENGNILLLRLDLTDRGWLLCLPGKERKRMCTIYICAMWEDGTQLEK